MSVDVVQGGQWRPLYFRSTDVSNGYTARFKADGRDYRMLRFNLMFVGQELALSVPNPTRMSGAVTQYFADGTANYNHPIDVGNTVYSLRDRGTGGMQGFLIPRLSIPGWLMCFTGHILTTPSGDPWSNPTAGASISFDGRLIFQKDGIPANDWDFEFGFGSYSGQVGHYSLLIEGLFG